MTKTPSLDRLAFMLAMLSAIGPFAIDAYLPAFPQIAVSLGATQLEVQQTLTVYMAALALMVLWHGALADRFGRRRVLLALTALFALASLICALAPSIEWLWVGRALQGVSGGAGVVVGRAVVRDLHEGPQAQRLMSRVMLIFALAPALAPMVGAGLLALAGWRSIFVFLAAFGSFLCWMIW
ncbi:MAG TPA: multidrug effflux MFS transporter, partial [Rhodocyclaceae bacterium]|nr:multidrug effflux MFS transporter [Rhodocyclaceae bacterium]